MNSRILVIDDDAELCEEITEFLRSSGYFAVGAANPKNGLGLVEAEHFDAVIIDYKMPEMNGIEVAREVKSKSPRTNVFIASGRPFIEKLVNSEDVFHLLSGVITKPFDPDDLLFNLTKAAKETQGL